MRRRLECRTQNGKPRNLRIGLCQNGQNLKPIIQPSSIMSVDFGAPKIWDIPMQALLGAPIPVRPLSFFSSDHFVIHSAASTSQSCSWEFTWLQVQQSYNYTQNHPDNPNKNMRPSMPASRTKAPSAGWFALVSLLARSNYLITAPPIWMMSEPQLWLSQPPRWPSLGPALWDQPHQLPVPLWVPLWVPQWVPQWGLQLVLQWPQGQRQLTLQEVWYPW